MALEHRHRLETLRKEMSDRNEAAYLVTDPKNRYYLSGFNGSSGWLILTQDRIELITDGRYWEQAAEQCPDVSLFRYVATTHGTLVKALGHLLDGWRLVVGKVAVEIDEMPVTLYRDLVAMLEGRSLLVSDVEGRVKKLRSRKDEYELTLLRRAARIADEAYSSVLSRFLPGMTERALRSELDYEVLRRGGDGASFPTIVASGVNGSFPHATATEKIIEPGELVTVDFGAIWKGYCSDMTRTFWFGTLSDRDRQLVDQVTAAQQAALLATQPGITAGALDHVARSHLGASGLGEYFTHSLGHGVGLDVHEAPFLRAGVDDILKEAQVITLEPGVYLPKETGCRIEDTVVVRARECEILNHAPKQNLEWEHPLRAKL